MLVLFACLFNLLFNNFFKIFKNGRIVKYIERNKYLREHSIEFYRKNFNSIRKLTIKFILEITRVYLHLKKWNKQNYFLEEK